MPRRRKAGKKGRGKAHYAPGKGQPMKDAANPTERNIKRVRRASGGDGPSERDARMAKRAKKIAKSKAVLGDELL